MLVSVPKTDVWPISINKTITLFLFYTIYILESVIKTFPYSYYSQPALPTALFPGLFLPQLLHVLNIWFFAFFSDPTINFLYLL